MAKLRDVSLPLADYPTGIVQYPQNPNGAIVPDTTTALYMEFARCTTATPDIWPRPDTTLWFDQWVSFDGGMIWQYGGGVGASGGIVVHTRTGLEIPLTTMRVPLPPGIGRRWKCKVTIANGPLRTQGAVEMRDTWSE